MKYKIKRTNNTITEKKQVLNLQSEEGLNMKGKLDSKRINHLRQAVFHNWVSFNAFTLFWFIIVLSVFYLFERGLFLFISLGVALVLFYFVVDVRYDVYEKAPTSFLKFEDVKRRLSKVYWQFIYPVTIALIVIYYLLPLKYNSIAEEIAPVFVPIFVGFVVIFVGTTIYQIAMIPNIRRHPWLLRARAEASFTVVSTSLTKPSGKKHRTFSGLISRAIFGKKSEEVKEKKKLIRTFENGIGDLNTLFIAKFNFEFSNHQKYSDYFSFLIWSGDSSEVNRVRKAIDLLAYSLRRKVELPETMWAIKQILEEKQIVSREEVFKELDFKTGINRWYNHNKERVQITLLAIPIIVSIIAIFL
jgi:hypothetical protein